ncbi:MAG: hypothetical protein ACHQIO_20800, partial [Nevskiales bacterium]
MAGDRREDVPLAALASIGVIGHHPVHHMFPIDGLMGQTVQREQAAGGVVAHQGRSRPAGLVWCHALRPGPSGIDQHA